MKHNQIKIGKKVWTVVKESIPLLNQYKNHKIASLGQAFHV